MKNKKVLLTIMVLSMFMLVACVSGPEKTVKEAVGAMQSFNLEKASQYLSEELREEYKESLEEQAGPIKGEETEKTKFPKELEGPMKKLSKELKYEILTSEVVEDKATLSLKIIYADASEPLIKSVGEMMDQIMGLAFSGQEVSEEESTKIIVDVVSKNLENYELKTNQTESIIKLAKESDKWVITEIDENTLNALTFGLTQGIQNFNPFDNLEIEG